MSETAISVADAAKDLPGVLGRMESTQQDAVLLQNGQPVAKLIPWRAPVVSCEELADWWMNRERLPVAEAEDFARDMERARAKVPPLGSAWD